MTVRMRVMIGMDPPNYDRFLNKVSPESRVYDILKNALITRQDVGEREVRVITILCERKEAEQLYDAAKLLCPAAAAAIEDALSVQPEE